jgi:hypothetical protein
MKSVILVLLAACACWGCRDDVTVDVSIPLSLVGSYDGIYTYTETGPDGLVNLDVSQPVEFMLGDRTYVMNKPASVAEADREFCDVSGDYEKLDSHLRFFESRPGVVVCIRDRDPVGEFSIDWVTDTLRLYQQLQDADGGRITKSLKLAPR